VTFKFADGLTDDILRK